MTAIKLSQPTVWGWETAQCYHDANYRISVNTVRVLGYFPFTGPCLAILKAAAFVALCAKGELDVSCARSIGIFTRIFIEFTGLAFLTLPLVDLIVTIHRGYTKKPNQMVLSQG